MFSQFQRNRRSAIFASVLFIALLVYTWHTLNIETLLPTPLSQGGHAKGHSISTRFHDVTCPAPVGEEGKSKRIPVIRGRNATVHGSTLAVPRVVVLIFYGRRNTVSILDCYLKVRTLRNRNAGAGVRPLSLW